MKKKKLKKRLKLLEQKVTRLSKKSINTDGYIQKTDDEIREDVQKNINELENRIKQLEQKVQGNGIMIKEVRDHVIELESNHFAPRIENLESKVKEMAKEVWNITEGKD